MGRYLDLAKQVEADRSSAEVRFISGRSLEFRKRLKLVRKRTGHTYRFKRWVKPRPPVVLQQGEDGEFYPLSVREAAEWQQYPRGVAKWVGTFSRREAR